MADYILTPTAQRDLQVIREYLAGAPGPIRERVIDELTQTFRQAALFPDTGRPEAELPRPHVITRSLLRYPYRIFYYPETSPTEIFAIIHGRRDPPTVLKAR
jgi:plasmid stabilization system protein ParE